MASNKRLIDIEREINDFFLSKEFEELAFSNGAYRLGDFSGFDIPDKNIESILKAVNEKIKEFIDNASINMFFKDNGIYIETDCFSGKRDYIGIGYLIMTTYGTGGRKCYWSVRFDNQYVYHTFKVRYHTFKVRSKQVSTFYRILDVKEMCGRKIGIDYDYD